jgi:hypothetical protein
LATRAAYNANPNDPKYAKAKGSLSRDRMLVIYSTGPFRKAKLPIKRRLPMVKQSTNLAGRNKMIGSPIKMPRAKKKNPRETEMTNPWKRCCRVMDGKKEAGCGSPEILSAGGTNWLTHQSPS